MNVLVNMIVERREGRPLGAGRAETAGRAAFAAGPSLASQVQLSWEGWPGALLSPE